MWNIRTNQNFFPNVSRTFQCFKMSGEIYSQEKSNEAWTCSNYSHIVILAIHGFVSSENSTSFCLLIVFGMMLFNAFTAPWVTNILCCVYTWCGHKYWVMQWSRGKAHIFYSMREAHVQRHYRHLLEFQRSWVRQQHTGESRRTQENFKGGRPVDHGTGLGLSKSLSRWAH